MAVFASKTRLPALTRVLSSAASASATTICRRLDKKVAPVTAFTDGIGLAVTRPLVREGARVVVSSRKVKNVLKAAKELESEGEVKGIACHVGDKDQRKALIEFTKQQFGGIDILVSNTAVSPPMGQFLDSIELIFSMK